MTVKMDDDEKNGRLAVFETEELIKGKENVILQSPTIIPTTEKYESHTGKVYNPLEVKIAGKKSVYMQIVMSVLANLTVLSSGMGLGYPAITIYAITRENDPMALTTEQGSWFVSISAFACPFGGLLSGLLLDKIGRKLTLIVINLISITSWMIIAFSSTTDKDVMYMQLMVARILIGITIGLASSPAAVYSAEIAAPRLRGRLTVLTSLAIAVGILIIYTMGYFVPDNFRRVSLIAALVCVVSMLLLIPLPESPSWLMLKRKEVQAEKSLKLLRGDEFHEEITMELDRLKKSVQMSSRKKQSVKEIVSQPQVYKPLLIIIGFFGFQQFSGIFVIIAYAANVSSEAGVHLDKFLSSVLIGVTRVVATLIVAYMLDSAGRKLPSYISGLGMTICMFGLAICSWLPTIEALKWFPVILILGYIFTSTVGFLTVPFAMLPELFPQQVRGVAAGMTIFAAYLMSFIIIKLYPTMTNFMGSANVFVFYGIVSFLGVVYVHFAVPETKGKTLQEIEDYFKGETNNGNVKEGVEDA